MLIFKPDEFLIRRETMRLCTRKFGLLITIFSSVLATCLMAWAVYSSSNVFFWLSAIVQVSGGYVISWSKVKDDREDSIVCCAIISGSMMLTAVVVNYAFFNVTPSSGSCLAWVMILIGFFILMKIKAKDLN
jgi:hypothetical protein